MKNIYRDIQIELKCLAKKTATPPTYVAETQTKYNQIKSFMQKKVVGDCVPYAGIEPASLMRVTFR